MCVICVKEKGVKMPSVKLINEMFRANPDGAGYMYARNGKVYISKGFMSINELLYSMKYDKLTDSDSVVFHFRISTQGKITREFTHPYPLTKNISLCKALEVECNVGIAHNGIINLTSDGNDNYNDTMMYITKYLSLLIRNKGDFYNPFVHKLIEGSISYSRLALLNQNGDVIKIGSWHKENGLYFSNKHFQYPLLKEKNNSFFGKNGIDEYFENTYLFEDSY